MKVISDNEFSCDGYSNNNTLTQNKFNATIYITVISYVRCLVLEYNHAKIWIKFPIIQYLWLYNYNMSNIIWHIHWQYIKVLRSQCRCRIYVPENFSSPHNMFVMYSVSIAGANITAVIRKMRFVLGFRLHANLHIDGLMQKRRNSTANALELRLFCSKL